MEIVAFKSNVDRQDKTCKIFVTNKGKIRYDTVEVEVCIVGREGQSTRQNKREAVKADSFIRTEKT